MIFQSEQNNLNVFLMLPTPFQYFQLVFLEHLEKEENNFGYSMAFVNMNLCVYELFLSHCSLTSSPFLTLLAFPFCSLCLASIIKNTQLL